MDQIRVLLYQTGGLTSNRIVAAVSAHPDVIVVRDGSWRGVEFLQAVRDSQPDVVVVGSNAGDLPGECTHMFDMYPMVTLLSVSDDCTQVRIYRFRLDVTDVSGSSTDEIINVLTQ